PVVRGAETPGSVDNVVVDSEKAEISLMRDGDIVTVTGVNDGTVSIFSINGVCRLSAEAANGGAIFNVSGLAKGIYVVATTDGRSAKFVK
ncbi:MAG: T9SS type A sorting domain-containing protein, partial [Muribaculaceae bacterium]|nr:T9SS type A sorting domain-containing protein [Muribaculaceae bacterium]